MLVVRTGNIKLRQERLVLGVTRATQCKLRKVAQNDVFRLSACSPLCSVLDRSAEAIANEIPKELICDYWSFDSSEAPVLRPRYTIHLTDNHDWKIYNNPPDDQKLFKEMVPFVAFVNDSQTLRIGTQLYARRGENSLDAIQGEKATAYVEEIARRDDIVILASRFRLNNRILEPFQDAETIADTEDYSEDESLRIQRTTMNHGAKLRLFTLAQMKNKIGTLAPTPTVTNRPMELILFMKPTTLNQTMRQKL
ncbi:hypothetical protein PC9H_005829 [Pleurotus ostreatus]|uniref:Uncharacterized protein n=1 Tax=Pleurotus ostreatus TaxID=5322 RepID=A0A8H7A1C6_PLEOS|nr:uncharacterized protein PC9H_005829 [Pleurotus ostreatus]KAF7433863.1 hypothetical protein PC9H_005829 [Pleurotus ostreatus]